WEFLGWRKLRWDEFALATGERVCKANGYARMIRRRTGPGDTLLLQALIGDTGKRWGQRHDLLPDLRLRRVPHRIAHAVGQIGNDVPIHSCLPWGVNGLAGQLHT